LHCAGTPGFANGNFSRREGCKDFCPTKFLSSTSLAFRVEAARFFSLSFFSANPVILRRRAAPLGHLKPKMTSHIGDVIRNEVKELTKQMT
jgi:hypothetical protein